MQSISMLHMYILVPLCTCRSLVSRQRCGAGCEADGDSRRCGRRFLLDFNLRER